MFSDEDN